jgi:hypothetical protein
MDGFVDLSSVRVAEEPEAPIAETASDQTNLIHPGTMVLMTCS